MSAKEIKKESKELARYCDCCHKAKRIKGWYCPRCLKALKASISRSAVIFRKKKAAKSLAVA